MKLQAWNILFLFTLSIKNINTQDYVETSGVECSQNIIGLTCILEENTKFIRPKFIQIGAKKYTISVDNKMNWFEANDRCLKYDAQLANIESVAELDAISNYLKEKGLKIRLFWISGNDLRAEGNFTMGDTGRAMAYTNWESGHPQTGENQDCVHLSGEKYERFVMQDANCHSKLEYICEEKTTDYDSLPTIKPPSAPFVKIGEKYYIFTSERMTWYEGADVCRRYNAQLANIESDYEKYAITRYLTENGWNDHFWISGNDLRQEGNWLWGDTGIPMTYTIWREGDPNNFSNREHCVVFAKYDQYLMIDAYCKAVTNVMCVW